MAENNRELFCFVVNVKGKTIQKFFAFESPLNKKLIFKRLKDYRFVTEMKLQWTKILGI